MMKYLIILIFLTSCNGGTTYYYSRDLQIASAGNLVDLDGEEPKFKRVLRRGDISGMVFYGEGFVGNAPYELIKERTIKGATSEEKCIYYLSYFLPLNFWDFRSNEAIIKKLIKKGAVGENIFSNILVRDIYLATPLFSYTCTKISGLPISK